MAVGHLDELAGKFVVATRTLLNLTRAGRSGIVQGPLVTSPSMVAVGLAVPQTTQESRSTLSVPQPPQTPHVAMPSSGAGAAFGS